MKSRCAVCGAENDVPLVGNIQPVEPPDFDTRPGEPLRSTLQDWVAACHSCGYCADDLTLAHPKAADVVASEMYQSLRGDTRSPAKANQFLCYAYLLDKVREHADAGWSALHAAWTCDDVGAEESAAAAREQAIEYWKRGKHAGQAFSDDLASEYALVADVYRRVGQFEMAVVTCSEALDMEDLPPVIEHVLRRQRTLIEQRDTSAHSIRELLANAG